MSESRLSLVLVGWVFLAPVLFGAEPLPAGRVNQIKVINDKAPDCSTLKSIVESVTRDCKTNDEKAIALYNFMRLTHYHRAYPSEPGGVPVLKEINCYGWSLCGGLHAEESALWRELGWQWRFVGWPGHTTVEAFYDGRWHYLDVFLKFYAWMPDPNNPGKRTIAGQDDLQAHPKELLFDAFVLDKSRRVYYMKGNEFEMIGEKANWQAPAFLVCGDDLAGVAEGVKKKSRAGSPEDWAGINHATGKYSTEVNLAPGFGLTSTWDPSADAWFWADSKIAPCHTCGDKEIRNSPEKGPVAEPYLGPSWKCESYANGQLTFQPDLTSASCLRSFAAVENVKVTEKGLVAAEAGQPARVTVLLQSPYLLTQVSGSAEGVDKFEVSIDGGKTWKAADLKEFGSLVKGKLEALARLTIRDTLQSLRIQATVQNNPFALPFLAPGKNTITVSVADPATLGDNKLVVTYAYRPGVRRKSYEQLCLEGDELSRGHGASWDAKPTVVQKVFTARDLPAKFDIDVPTPKDKYPVYPRMLFVRREVVAPDQKPLPLPEGAQEAKIGPQDELKTLPNPLLVGTQPPPPKIVRAVKTVTLELTAGGFVTKSGQAPAGDLLQWPKNNQEKVEPVAMLIGGELKGLPALKDLAGARLVFPVVRAHEKAPTKVGVTALQAPFTPGQGYDFNKLGDVLATAIVPTLARDAADWSPPKEFKLDVSRAIRSVILGDAKFHGFALRVVPDRGVDDGWTVRVQLPKQPKVALELDVYADAPAKTDPVPKESGKLGAESDPYETYVKTSKDFRPVKQDRDWLLKAYPGWLYMPWTFRWTIGYNDESGKWSLEHGYNGAFIDRGDVAADGSKTGRIDWINKHGLHFYMDHLAGKRELHLWDGKIPADVFDKVHGNGVRVIPVNEAMRQRLYKLMEKNITAVKLSPYRSAYALDDEISWGHFVHPTMWRVTDDDAAYPAWLKEIYGPDAPRRDHWVTYEDIRPKLGTWSVKEFDASPLLDQWTFNDSYWNNFIGDLVEFSNKIDPDTPCGWVGGQSPNAFGGYDYAKVMRKVQFIEAYNIGGSQSIVRSFNPHNAIPAVTSHFHRAAADTIWQTWYYLAHGNRGHIGWVEKWFDDKTPRPWHEEVAPTFLEAGKRIGPLMSGTEWRHDGVAIYYSHASIQLGWVMDAAAHGKTWVNRNSDERLGSSHQGRKAWENMLRDSGLQYSYISYADVVQNGIPTEYKVLILPACLCLSDVEAKRIRAFVEAGGTVIADYLPGLWDQHGKGRATGGVLDELFGVKHSPDLKAADLFGGTLWCELDQDANFGWKTYADFLTKSNTCIQDASGFDKAVRTMDVNKVNRVGKGTAVLLNLSPQWYNAHRAVGAEAAAKRTTFMNHVETAVGKRWISLKGADEKGFGHEITYWRKDGRTMLFVFMNPEIAVSSTGGGNSVGLKADVLPVTLTFAGKLNGVRDERSGKALADGTEFKFDWKMNEAIVLSFDGAPPSKR